MLTHFIFQYHEIRLVNYLIGLAHKFPKYYILFVGSSDIVIGDKYYQLFSLKERGFALTILGKVCDRQPSLNDHSMSVSPRSNIVNAQT